MRAHLHPGVSHSRFAFVFIVVLIRLSSSGQLQKISGDIGKPLVVMVEHDPWLMVLNADEPKIAIYSGGKIIYQKQESGRRKFYSVVLDTTQLKKLMDKLNLDNDSIYNLPNSIDPYEKSGISFDDLPTNELYIYTRDSVKFISVYGDRSSSAFYKWVPEFLKNIFKTLAEFDSPDATPWLPEKIEVVVWGYRYSPEIPIDWPKDWPDTKSADSYLHASSNTGDMYSIFLDITHLDELKQMLYNRKLKQAIRMNGKKWSMSYRFPFPGQPTWWW